MEPIEKERDPFPWRDWLNMLAQVLLIWFLVVTMFDRVTAMWHRTDDRPTLENLTYSEASLLLENEERRRLQMINTMGQSPAADKLITDQSNRVVTVMAAREEAWRRESSTPLGRKYSTPGPNEASAGNVPPLSAARQ